ISRISVKSNEVLEKMDHIIWTLDSVHNHLPDLIYFIHEQSARFLEDTNIDLQFHTEDRIPNLTIDTIRRRNLSLVIKELVHNTVKHSGATLVTIKVSIREFVLYIGYTDNGKGYILSEVAEG